jgi:hypothetical protein
MSTSRTGAFTATLAITLVVLSGCSRQSSSTPDDVILHLKMTRIDGTPRALSTNAQLYVERILAADEQVRASLAELIRVRDGEYLWPPDAEKWFDVAAIEQRLATLDKIINEQAPQRAETLNKLTQAIDQIPTGLLGLEDSDRIFRDAVWTALKWEFGDLRYLEAALMPIVARHKLLYARALKRAAAVDPQQPGQAATKPEGRDVVELFFELRLDVLAKREAAAIIVANDLAEAEGFVTDLKAELASLQKELEDRATTAADKRRLQWIRDLIAYETARAEHCRKLEEQIAQDRSLEADVIERLQASRPATQPATQPAPGP